MAEVLVSEATGQQDDGAYNAETAHCSAVDSSSQQELVTLKIHLLLGTSPEIVEKVLSRLTYLQLLRVRLVNKLWNSIALKTVTRRHSLHFASFHPNLCLYNTLADYRINWPYKTTYTDLHRSLVHHLTSRPTVCFMFTMPFCTDLGGQKANNKVASNILGRLPPHCTLLNVRCGKTGLVGTVQRDLQGPHPHDEDECRPASSCGCANLHNVIGDCRCHMMGGTPMIIINSASDDRNGDEMSTVGARELPAGRQSDRLSYESSRRVGTTIHGTPCVKTSLARHNDFEEHQALVANLPHYYEWQSLDSFKTKLNQRYPSIRLSSVKDVHFDSSKGVFGDMLINVHTFRREYFPEPDDSNEVYDTDLTYYEECDSRYLKARKYKEIEMQFNRRVESQAKRDATRKRQLSRAFPDNDNYAVSTKTSKITTTPVPSSSKENLPTTTATPVPTSNKPDCNTVATNSTTFSPLKSPSSCIANCSIHNRCLSPSSRSNVSYSLFIHPSTTRGTLNYTMLCLPDIPGVHFHPFRCESITPSFTSSDGAHFLETHAGIRRDEHLKALLLFQRDVSDVNDQTLLPFVEAAVHRNKGKVAVGGLLVDGADLISDGSSRKTGYSETLCHGLAVSGAGVTAASIVLESGSLSNNYTLARLAEMKSAVFPPGTSPPSPGCSFAVMLSCVGRKNIGKNYNKELNMFRAVFPDTPLFGAYGYGEFCHHYLPGTGDVDQTPDEDLQFEYSYTTVFVLLRLPNH